MTLYIYIYIQLLVRMTFFYYIQVFIIPRWKYFVTFFYIWFFFTNKRYVLGISVFYLLKYINSASNDLSTLWASCIILYTQVPRWSRWSKPFLFIKCNFRILQLKKTTCTNLWDLYPQNSNRSLNFLSLARFYFFFIKKKISLACWKMLPLQKTQIWKYF